MKPRVPIGKRLEEMPYRVDMQLPPNPFGWPQEKVINPHRTFEGDNGKSYEIMSLGSPNDGNCYSFVLGIPLEWPRGVRKAFYPGILSGKPMRFGQIEKLVKSDLKVLGIEVYETIHTIPKKLPECKEGYWIICYLEEGNRDFHFSMKHPDGYLLHKGGWGAEPSVMTRIEKTVPTKLLLKKNDEWEINMMLLMMKMNPACFKSMDEKVTAIINCQNLPPLHVIRNSILKGDDSAAYMKIVSGQERLVPCNPVFAMRISSP